MVIIIDKGAFILYITELPITAAHRHRRLLDQDHYQHQEHWCGRGHRQLLTTTFARSPLKKS